MDLAIGYISEDNSKIRKKSNYHHGDLRSSILLAVGKLIESQRSTEFQLKEVAALVNTSVPAIYRHFESKSHLLVEMAIEGYGLQKSFRDYAMSVNSQTPLHRLIAIGFAYIAFAKEHPGLFILMKNLETPSMLENAHYSRQREETIALVSSIFEECVKEGLFLTQDTEIGMTFLQATSFGFAQMIISKSMNNYAPIHGQDTDLAAKIYELTLRGLLTEKGKALLRGAIIDPFAKK